MKREFPQDRAARDAATCSDKELHESARVLAQDVRVLSSGT